MFLENHHLENEKRIHGIQEDICNTYNKPYLEHIKNVVKSVKKKIEEKKKNLEKRSTALSSRTCKLK